MSPKHHVELTDGAPVFFATDGALGMGGEEFVGSHGLCDAGRDFVGAKTGFALLALDEWVGESGGVTRGFPGARIHENSGVDAVHIIAHLDEIMPPSVHEVFL